MSQFYPQQTPSYPPQRPPEDEYYYEEDDYDYEEYEDDDEGSNDSLIKYALGFVAGGCLVFLCMSCCFLLAGGLWTVDSAWGGTPIPGSDIGLEFDNAAYVDESVINDQKVGLTILDVNRNASLPTMPVVEGREIIILTVELENSSDEDVRYSEQDFSLLNSPEQGYAPIPGGTVIEGALGNGKLKPEETEQGRLVFEVLAGELELVLVWEAGDSTRFISLR